jgi:transcriptional regulator with XRE-family HTH domain
MAKLKRFDLVREKWLKEYEVGREYDALETEFQIAAEIIKARTRARMTQAELAERLDTKPSAISRLESLNYGKASVSTFKKIAGALNCGQPQNRALTEAKCRRLTPAPSAQLHMPGAFPKTSAKVDFTAGRNVKIERASRISTVPSGRDCSRPVRCQ